MLFMFRTGVVIVIAYYFQMYPIPAYQAFYVGCFVGMLLFFALPMFLKRYTLYR